LHKKTTYLHGQVTAAICKDKEQYMQQQCEKLEKHAEMGNIRGLFQMVKKLSKFQPRFLNIRDKHGEILI